MEAPSLISRRDNVYLGCWIYSSGCGFGSQYFGHDGVRNELREPEWIVPLSVFSISLFRSSLFCSLHHINLYTVLFALRGLVFSSFRFIISYKLRLKNKSAQKMIKNGKTRIVRTTSCLIKPGSIQLEELNLLIRAPVDPNPPPMPDTTRSCLEATQQAKPTLGKGKPMEAYLEVVGSLMQLFFTTFYCSRGHCRPTAAINQPVVFINQPITEPNWTWVPGWIVCFRQLQWDGSSKTCAPVCPPPFGIG